MAVHAAALLLAAALACARAAAPPRCHPSCAAAPPRRSPPLQAERDIEERKRELEGARLELAHKQEYEAVKRQIMQARFLYLSLFGLFVWRTSRSTRR